MPGIAANMLVTSSNRPSAAIAIPQTGPNTECMSVNAKSGSCRAAPATWSVPTTATSAQELSA